MIYNIENSRFTAQVDSLGAQLISLKDREGFEYIWTGEKRYWHEHAPVLFPIVGALRQGRTKIDGQWYEMGRHGFAKGQEFTLVSRGEDAISLCLTDSPATREVYPFKFRLQVSYSLTGQGIDTKFSVENTGERDMHYCIGGHPGFNIPVKENAAFEDYSVQFSLDEDQTCPIVDMSAGLIDWSQQGFRLKGREIPLKHSLFYQDALVFENLRSSKVSIVNKTSGKGIEMDFSGFPMLGIWSAKNDGPYVCLEPWTGCATLTTEGDEFVEKKGMRRIQPGQREEHRFSVEVTV